MKMLEQANRLKRIDDLIRRQSTGAPQEFARKLEVSVSTLYELLDLLKQLGAEIKYNKHRLTYIYLTPVKSIFKLEKEDIDKIKGGKNISLQKNQNLFLYHC
ncbi:MAG: hypothetical protein MI739_12205 [Bacteroidales bacterium]|nr:hypothetical protein [Bacteroidales bacterium]